MDTESEFIAYCNELFTECDRAFDVDEFKCLQSLFSRIEQTESNNGQRVEMALRILDDLEDELETDSEEKQSLYDDVFSAPITDTTIRDILRTQYLR